MGGVILCKTERILNKRERYFLGSDVSLIGLSWIKGRLKSPCTGEGLLDKISIFAGEKCSFIH